METLDAEIDGFRSGNFNPHILNNNKKSRIKKQLENEFGGINVGLGPPHLMT